IYFLDLARPLPSLRKGATWLVTVNYFNLLPFAPLDGGKLCDRLLFSRLRWVEALSEVLAVLGLVSVCWGRGWICLALSGAFALLLLVPDRYKTATAAMAVQSRWPDLPPRLVDLGEDQWRDLFTATRGAFRISNPGLLATRIKSVHSRALEHP